MNIYEYTVKSNKGENISLSSFQGNVLLIVNTATKCGLTPQYTALERLYKAYHKKGFEILDFPCNQFLEQAPGSDEEIERFCEVNYQTTFRRFAKIDVNGPEESPLYTYLKQEQPIDKGDMDSAVFEKKVASLKKLEKPEDIKWNFGKFLVNREGKVIARFSPALDMEKVEAEIKAIL